MAAVEIKVPSVGESVQEAVLAEWYKSDGDWVEKDEALFVLETDKVTLDVTAEADGRLAIRVKAGQTVAVGDVVGTIDTDADDKAADDEAADKEDDRARKKGGTEEAAASADEKADAKNGDEDAAEDRGREDQTPSAGNGDRKRSDDNASDSDEKRPSPDDDVTRTAEAATAKAVIPPSVRRLADAEGIDWADIEGTGPEGAVTRMDVYGYLAGKKTKTGDEPAAPPSDEPAAPATTRKKMSPIRRRIAQRLLTAKQQTAMLTTFNEIDMSRVMTLRKQNAERFEEVHQVRLGFMSFFIKASVAALLSYPEINAYLDGEEIVYHEHCHVGVAVGSDRGLVVPVIRRAETLGFAALEQAIIDFVDKIENNKLALSDLEGGTFTVTNGGVYGSLLSTPILNPPQSAILGMHKIEKRPVVVDDAVVIRPMMYVALSYDHRIVDGKDAVGFLKQIKESVESPERLMLGL